MKLCCLLWPFVDLRLPDNPNRKYRFTCDFWPPRSYAKGDQRTKKGNYNGIENPRVGGSIPPRSPF